MKNYFFSLLFLILVTSCKEEKELFVTPCVGFTPTASYDSLSQQTIRWFSYFYHAESELQRVFTSQETIDSLYSFAQSSFIQNFQPDSSILVCYIDYQKYNQSLPTRIFLKGTSEYIFTPDSISFRMSETHLEAFIAPTSNPEDKFIDRLNGSLETKDIFYGCVDRCIHRVYLKNGYITICIIVIDGSELGDNAQGQSATHYIYK